MCTLCGHVIVNKRSFESFMCLDVKNIDFEQDEKLSKKCQANQQIHDNFIQCLSCHFQHTHRLVSCTAMESVLRGERLGLESGWK